MVFLIWLSGTCFAKVIRSIRRSGAVSYLVIGQRSPQIRHLSPLLQPTLYEAYATVREDEYGVEGV